MVRCSMLKTLADEFAADDVVGEYPVEEEQHPEAGDTPGAELQRLADGRARHALEARTHAAQRLAELGAAGPGAGGGAA